MGKKEESKQSYKRDHAVYVRLTKDEFEAVKKAASIRRRTVSGYIRSQIVVTVALPKP